MFQTTNQWFICFKIGVCLKIGHLLVDHNFPCEHCHTLEWFGASHRPSCSDIRIHYSSGDICIFDAQISNISMQWLVETSIWFWTQTQTFRVPQFHILMSNNVKHIILSTYYEPFSNPNYQPYVIISLILVLNNESPVNSPIHWWVFHTLISQIPIQNCWLKFPKTGCWTTTSLAALDR